VRRLRLRKRDPQAAYRDFEAKFIGLVRCYWRTNETASLDSARTAVVRLSARASRDGSAQQQVTSFEGWVGTHDGFAVRTRRLRTLNLGYRVAVEKRRRPDVDEDLGSTGLAAGFVVRAVGSVNLPPFTFGVTDRQGNLCPLKASNPVAEEDLESFWPRNGQEISVSTTDNVCTPLGYIDAVTQVPWASSDESTWFAALVNRFPAELFEVAQHSGDPELAATAAVHLGGVQSNAEWADRFGMLAGERPCGQRSDLVPVEVWRPMANGDNSVVTTPAPCPERIRHNDVWVYRSGPESLPVPDQQWLVVEDATVQDGGTILARGRLIVYEGSADPSLDFVSGQWESVFGSAFLPDRALVRLREKSSRRIPEAVLLSGRNDDNWYHWMVEYLPRIFQIDSSVPSSAPFIVSSRTPPSGIEALERFTDREIIVVDAALAHGVGQLHVLPPSVQVLDTTRVPWSKGLSMNAAPLLEFRRRLGLGDHGLAGEGRRVFLERTSSRRGLVNQPELAEIASRLGLELVDPSGLSWQEQIELFSSSSLVVGASGAVMANYLLMAPGSRVLALTSDSLADFVLPAALAGISEAAFSYLTGPNESSLEDHLGRNSWLHSSFSIRPKNFERAVRREIGSLDG
jgi:capsular polysaccharide biosynthesis protein